MKKVIMTAALSMALAAPAFADDVKIGVILGYTGPIESSHP
jgi:branched-chain amino acid transport system substrate-binding protein